MLCRVRKDAMALASATRGVVTAGNTANRVQRAIFHMASSKLPTPGSLIAIHPSNNSLFDREIQIKLALFKVCLLRHFVRAGTLRILVYNKGLLTKQIQQQQYHCHVRHTAKKVNYSGVLIPPYPL